MKRIATTILPFALLIAAAAPAVQTQGVSVRAENAQSQKTELFMPQSYEQYLPLTSPSDVAVSADYIAVADGTKVHVYSKTVGTYSSYEHSTGVNGVDFYGDKLYFVDQQMKLFSIPAGALPTQPLVGGESLQTCISFSISADVLHFVFYSSGVAQIASAPISNPYDVTEGESFESKNAVPAIATDDGKLYYTHESVLPYLYRFQEENDYHLTLPHSSISSIAIKNDVLYYTAPSGFYAYDMTALVTDPQNALVFEKSGEFSAAGLGSDGNVYCIEKSKNALGAYLYSVKQYSPDEQDFTSYEISSSSTSPHRLAGGTDMTVCGDTLITTDAAAARITVTAPNATFVIPAERATLVASDGKTALIADTDFAALYDLQTKQRIDRFTAFATPIVGVTNVYGTYYIATQGGFCKLEQVDETTWQQSATVPTTETPKLLTSDVFGDLYVAYADGVYAYTQTEFLDPTTKKTAEDKLATTPTGATKLFVDFERNIYALVDGSVQNLTATQNRSLAKELVYSQTATTPVTSVAFSHTDNAAYILYDGNFVAKTPEFDLPSLKNIPVGTAANCIFGTDSAQFSLVEIRPDALYIDFDIHTLQGATAFPYLAHRLDRTAKTALKLGETDRFNVIALFDETTRTYTTSLVEKTACVRELDESEFLTPAVGFENGATGYISNTLPLYKFPYLTDLLTLGSLEKHTAVTVLGQIDHLDYKYYLVSYIGADGTEKRGYIPQAYLSSFDSRPPLPDTLLLGETATDYDSVWRAAFLLLGLALVGILTDYLILRKPHDD